MYDCGGIKVLKKNDGKCSNITSAYKDEVSRFEKHDICYLCLKKRWYVGT